MALLSIIAYSFDIRNNDEKAAYEVMCKAVPASEKFDCLADQRDMGAVFKSESVALDGKYLFDNQFNTVDGRRLFDWYEPIFPNKTLKRGYYVENLVELQALRKARLSCGYCGYQTDDKIDICPKCLGSEYLTEDYLPLLKMQSISSKDQRVLPPDILAELTERWKLAHAETMKVKAQKSIEHLISRTRQDAIDAKTKLAGLEWLVDHGFYAIDKVIFYPHRQIFTFGWQDSNRLTSAEKSLILEIASEFPFDYEITGYQK